MATHVSQIPQHADTLSTAKQPHTHMYVFLSLSALPTVIAALGKYVIMHSLYISAFPTDREQGVQQLHALPTVDISRLVLAEYANARAKTSVRQAIFVEFPMVYA